MNNYRYQLEKYRAGRNRFNCPNCKGRKTFTRYVDIETGEYIHDSVGRCDREDRCGYHYPPREYFKDNNIVFENTGCIPNEPVIIRNEQPSYIDFNLFEKSLSHFEHNNFFLFLKKLFGSEKAIELVERYYIGTSKHWHNSTVFWQIDTNFKIHTGKIMQFEQETGKRVKSPSIT